MSIKLGRAWLTIVETMKLIWVDFTLVAMTMVSKGPAELSENDDLRGDCTMY